MASTSALKASATQTKEKAIVVLSDLKEKATETKEKAKAKAVVALRDMKTQATETKDKTIVFVRDPHFQMCTITTASGAITLGSIGGAFGLASGVAVGSAAGVVPALLTFGLSIPAGAVVGGSVGLCTGTLVGGTSGGIGGFATYKYRVQIKDGFISVQVKAKDTFNCTKEKASAVLSTARTFINTQVAKVQASVCDIAVQVRTRSIATFDIAKAKSCDAVTFATSTKAGVTSTSAVAGAVVGGAGTGAVGTVVGAAVGIVPAIFTFGLSIPAGAMVGLCVGTTVGASTGAVGGGLAGYGGFTYRKAITEGAQSSWGKVRTAATNVKAKTISCAAEAKESARSMVRGSTGGSEHVKAE